MRPFSLATRGILTFTALVKLASTEEQPIYRRTMVRRLLAVHANDREAGRQTDWLMRFGNQWRVNMSRLAHVHPEFFEAKYVSRDEFDEMGERLDELEAKHSETRMRVNAHGAKLRELSKGAA